VGIYGLRPLPPGLGANQTETGVAMFDEPELTSDERKLEAALSHVSPRNPHIDAASIAYQAGLRVARRGVIAWRAVAAVLLVAVISMPLLRTPPSTFERIVFVTA